MIKYALLAENPDGRRGLQQLDTLAHTEGKIRTLNHDPYALALVICAPLLAENPDGRRGLQQLDTLSHTEGKIWYV